jgi:Na+:H+ antiporter, NhaA family
MRIGREPKPLITKILTPFQEFLHHATSGGIILLIFTVIALVWANSPWADSYFATWNTKFTVALGGAGLSKPLLLWINDGLMAIFFFVVGLEIKREIVAGELTTLRKATLPVAAAIGGMIVPALLYTALNHSGAGAAGWGIPMATDIAFSLGVLQLLGPRVPIGLKIFLTAFAIVDDIGAVLVIALFYTSNISGFALGVAAVLLAIAVFFNVSGVRRPLPYAIMGVLLWIAILKSGVHATVAGVLLAMTIPARTRIAEKQFLDEGHKLLQGFEGAGPLDVELGLNEDRQSVVNTLEDMAEGVQTPVHRLEEALHPWVAFVILPIFAFANAGVSLAGSGVAAVAHPVSLGILVGLLVGKFIGVSAFSWLAVRMNMASLPTGVTWKHILGVALLGGIGFTMSLFVAGLAFDDPALLNSSKIGILAGSIISGTLGAIMLLRILESADAVPANATAPPRAVEEAEAELKYF